MNAVQKLFEADHKYFDLKEISSQEYEKMIAPLRDVESVVRCKDCNKRGTSECYVENASGELAFPWIPQDDWFCADGKRKEGDGE